MVEFFQQNPFCPFGIAIAAAFVFTLIRQYRDWTNAQSPDERLAGAISRGALGIRKVNYARRILLRFKAARCAAFALPMPDMFARMRKAKSSAGYGANRLQVTLRDASKDGIPTQMAGNLRRYLQVAQETEQACRDVVTAIPTSDWLPELLSADQIASAVESCNILIHQSHEALEFWKIEARQAREALTGTLDPWIVWSGGNMRNPTRAKSLAENRQTNSLVLLQWLEKDIGHLEDCLQIVQQAVDVLRGNWQPNWTRTLQAVSAALDALDETLGDVDTPLPHSLAEGETLDLPPDTPMPGGFLLKLYQALGMIEPYLLSLEYRSSKK